MKNCSLRKLITFFGIFLTIVCQGQDTGDITRSHSNRNIVRSSVGFVGLLDLLNPLPFYSNVSIAYERSLWVRNDKFINSISLVAGGGFFTLPHFAISGLHFDVLGQVVLGKGSSHIELGLGVLVVNAVYNGSPFNEIFKYGITNWYPAPAANLGYRFQDPEGGIVLRSGFGFPEGFYMGVGWGF